MSYVDAGRRLRRACVASAVRRAVDAVDAGLAVAQVEDHPGRPRSRVRTDGVHHGASPAIAAGVALALGVDGIYGVMSYIVTQRTGEIGVRLALGAEPCSVAALIVRQGAVWRSRGIVIGLSAVAGRQSR